MFKPYIVSKNGDYAIQRSIFGHKQYNYGYTRYMWTSDETSASIYSSFETASEKLNSLSNPIIPPKWKKVTSVESINATPV